MRDRFDGLYDNDSTIVVAEGGEGSFVRGGGVESGVIVAAGRGRFFLIGSFVEFRIVVMIHSDGIDVGGVDVMVEEVGCLDYRKV